MQLHFVAFLYCLQAITAANPCLHMYTINGHLLLEKELSECLNTFVLADTHFITGNAKGFVIFRDLFR